MRGSIISEICSAAELICNEIEIDDCFPQVRQRKRKRFADEFDEQRGIDYSSEQQFAKEINDVLDKMSEELRSRYEVLA